MPLIEFKGFEGVRLIGDIEGSPDDPLVLLLHGGGQTRKVWTEAATALVGAGRQVINLDLRGHGESDWPGARRYAMEAFTEDLRLVLGQLPSRPVVVAANLGGWIAADVLSGEGGNLATGLVLADAPPKIAPDAGRALHDQLKLKISEQGSRLEWDSHFLDAMDIDRTTTRLKELAPTLALPTLFVRGAQSRLTPRLAAEEYVANIPNAEFTEIEDAGHLVAADRAEMFNAVLLDFLERRVPRQPPEYRQGSDARTLRDALGCFATGVTVVTTYAPDGTPVGLTANSFTSVSLDPPLLLVCVAKSASTLPCFLENDGFAVNVLHIGQQPTSNRFTRKDIDRFDTVPWDDGMFHLPLLSGALANFECKKEAVHDAGDHVLIVGNVQRARYEPRRDPLLYFRGKYRRIHIG
jgi:flavin reductase (DIM6/NTAB) family NADH-FMN oxidoreductase RutF/pimeloyl-ACP methyl ester carboxylesterase